ncbi:uncharacterized protein LOC143817877 isoform X3 [Ranitomeya variabilis]|uniref:uncharacterized protein LOC143817877 isoform X3 n=1 Tax=Ranitomeya variabilis TaxID=490064 RepID=UPI00405658AE
MGKSGDQARVKERRSAGTEHVREEEDRPCPGEEQITKVTGSSVTFRAGGDVQPSEITWLKNEIKIVDLEEGKEPDFYGFYNIKDRVDLNLMEKIFILQDLTPEDSGLYKAVLLVDGQFRNLFFSLRVLDPVCKVSVQNTTVGHNVTLSCSCSSDGAQPLQYKWRNVTHQVSGQQNLTISDQQNLTVSMGKEPQTLWCVASNEVSSSKATITVPPRVPEEKKTGVYGSHHIIIAVSAITIVIIVLITALYNYKNSPCCVHSVTAARHRKELQMGKDVPPMSSVPDNGSCGGSYTVWSDTE